MVIFLSDQASGVKFLLTLFAITVVVIFVITAVLIIKFKMRPVSGGRPRLRRRGGSGTMNN